MSKEISSLMPEAAGLGLSQLLVEVEFDVPGRQCVNFGICKQGPVRSIGKWRLFEGSVLQFDFPLNKQPR